MNSTWHLSHARGYIELGMLAEAAAELNQIAQAEKESSVFLEVSAALFQEQRDWPRLQRTARELSLRHPENASWWIMYAYGTRRAQSIEHAEAILKEAEKLHPQEPTIQFNLGCYACQRGEIETAQVHVNRAILLDPHFEYAAKNDPDLEPLRSRRETRTGDA